MAKSMFTKKICAALFAAYVFLSSSLAYAKIIPPYVKGNTADSKPPTRITETIPEYEPPIYSPPIEQPIEQPSITPQDGEGLEFLVYHQNGVMAFAIIAAHENYTVRPVMANNHIQGCAPLSRISSNYNEIAMINANYFFRDGAIIGILKIDNEIVGTGEYSRSAIGINPDGSIIFGKVGYYGVVTINNGSYAICGVDCDRPKDSIVLYNSSFGASTNTNNYGVELIIRNGIVTDIARGRGNNYIPSDGYIISAQGDTNHLFSEVSVGDYVNLQEGLISDNGKFNEAVHIVGAGPRLVQNSQVYVTANEEYFPADIRVGRAPRSAFGVTKYGDYIFAVVDGRQSHSRGCTLQEWADILINQFGAVDAINLDGGGSTELIVNDNIVNIPSDGQERAVGSALMILPR